MAAPEHGSGRDPEAWGPALEALPGVLRLGAQTLGHTTSWTISTYARTWTRFARAAVDDREAAALGEDLTALAAQVAGLVREAAHGTPVADILERWGPGLLDEASSVLARRGAAMEKEVRALREIGEALLRRSRDVRDDDSRHPAYAGVLRDLAPDEARILVLLLRDGPQPIVDVLVGGVVGRWRSCRLIAGELSMIGPHAGVRRLGAVHAYLNNLARLGLVWCSPEPVSELRRYQVVEAQPDVLEAMHSVRFPKVVRRSIHLTPFGVGFCRTCLVDPEDLVDLPEQGIPQD